ncbi:MAG TPA: hypothetical protein VNI84_18250 [Pyrinomonadaceae bacterium]|nr:hypothetical protein [Pyrinomonadaceae bacterium]
MKINLQKFYALAVAFAFVFCALLFSPPDVSAGQTRQANKSVCDFSQTAKAAVQPTAIFQSTFTEVGNENAPPIANLTEFYKPTAPFVAYKQENAKLMANNRAFRPPNLRKYGVVGWKRESKFPKYIRTNAV